MAGIYIHIPFCASFCTYCGFYSELLNNGNLHTRAGKGISVSHFTDALEREMALRQAEWQTHWQAPRTLYVGGGTPSLLEAGDIEQIVRHLEKYFDLSSLEEFTVEVNPDDMSGHDGALLAEACRAVGVNRISMGVQAFQDRHLRWMNRRHSAAQIYEAYNMLRQKGFDNLSIDLIFGYAPLLEDEWAESLTKAIELSPEHISAYQMSIDKESALCRMVSDGKYIEPEDEICAAQYAMLQKRLADNGYMQYEISNFCQPGRHSRHNSAYWNRTPYLGFGPAAHSFDGDRLRKWNIDDLEQWAAALMQNDGNKPFWQQEKLTDNDIYNEELMLSLRTEKGVRASLLQGAEHKERLKYNPATERYYIAPSDYFIADDIISDFIRT
ncbi:MAG: radical SAM family heme chaperone HemW [Bacteroidales bacterium]|nr:radical SAM family heme chaperone HemW [Bacteroidales bacterium]